jgi:hypothetical protein
MHRMGFEPTVPVIEREKIFCAFGHVATLISVNKNCNLYFYTLIIQNLMKIYKRTQEKYIKINYIL